jgi:malonate-semialdehyde dehydrogenase (acetylating)/methylmalonate-semialdehyde dehydrogenase
VINPATQEVLAQVPFATDAEIDAAIASAKTAFKTWRTRRWRRAPASC